MIYFVRCAATGLVKIGFTLNLQRRLVGLSTGSAAPLECVGVLPGNAEIERQLHARFSHLRRRGEWFEVDSELAELLASAKPAELPTHKRLRDRAPPPAGDFDNLADAMREASINDCEMGRRTGYSSQQINRVRRGVKSPSRALALALARELGGRISADQILGTAPDAHPSEAEAA